MKRILVGISGTPATPCKIEYAIELAKRHGAKLDMLSVIDVDRLAHVGPVPIGGTHFADRIRDDRVRQSHENAEKAIAAFKVKADAAGIDYTHVTAEGDPFELLAAHWRYNDLCLLGLRGWFDYGIMPDPHGVLIRLTKGGIRPILAVAETYRQVRTAVIAYNGSKEAASAMKRFVRLRIWPDMTLHILCLDPSKEKAAGLLGPAADYCRAHGYPVTTSHDTGDPAECILRHAQEVNADVLVLGSSYHRALLQSVFSDTALSVIQQSNIPIFMDS